MNRRVVFFHAARAAAMAAGAAGLLNAAARGAAASDEWCSSDPLVKVVTPGGSKEYVHVTFSAPSSQFRQNLIAAKDSISWTAMPAPSGAGTDVTVTSTVPLNGLAPFATRATISTGPFGGGTVYSIVDGIAGSALVNTYRLSVQ
ncbi:MAG TPA: hypothetical protein VNM48_01085 [Chloroflexota bacterium]|nr:hypothetical protein [Chloroflexota bacterium]